VEAGLRDARRSQRIAGVLAGPIGSANGALAGDALFSRPPRSAARCRDDGRGPRSDVCSAIHELRRTTPADDIAGCTSSFPATWWSCGLEYQRHSLPLYAPCGLAPGKLKW